MADYKPVPNNVSGDTVKVLEHLLSDARDGRMIGIAFIGIYKGRQYVVDTAGEARRDPIRTRGMAVDLLLLGRG